MKRYKHFIFDIDGTLIDNESANLLAFQRALQDEGICRALADLRFSLGIPGKVSMERLGAADIDAAVRRWGVHYQRLAADGMVKPFGGITEMLRVLKDGGHILGIVTSKNRAEYLDEFCKSWGFAALFDGYICSDDTANPKPHAEPLLTILERLQIEAKDTLYLGDSVYDMQCANAAGVDFGAALWGAVSREALTNCAVRLKTPAEVPLYRETLLFQSDL